MLDLLLHHEKLTGTCCLLVSRKYEVDGISLRPTWVPHVAKATANSQIDFTLQLMTGINYTCI